MGRSISERKWLKVLTGTFFLICQIFVLNICVHLGFWAVEGAMCKILECLGQHPRRNNLPKLTIFYPIFQLPFFGSGQDEMLESSRTL